jgi:hypothetical protein
MSKDTPDNINESYLSNFIGYDLFNNTKSFKKDASLFDSITMASFIRSNCVDIRSNENMLFSVYKKIIPYEKILKDILTYEFLFYEPKDSEKVGTIDELINLSISELKKYQGIVGGFYIEDMEWLQCTSDIRFKIKPNQKIIYNTIETCGSTDRDNVLFLKDFVNHMKRFINNDKITMSNKIFDDENNEISWILLVFEENNPK